MNKLIEAVKHFFAEGWDGLPKRTYQDYERVIEATKEAERELGQAKASASMDGLTEKERRAEERIDQVILQAGVKEFELDWVTIKFAFRRLLAELKESDDSLLQISKTNEILVTELDAAKKINEHIRLREQAVQSEMNRERARANAAEAKLIEYENGHWVKATQSDIFQLRKRADAAEKERDEMQALFDLQHKRTVEADKLWQKAHPGNELVWPDLGELIRWLMERADIAESKREHSVYWYGTRFDTLADWARKQVEPIKTAIFGIIANGSPDVFGPHEHAQNYNRLKHRAEAAEARIARLIEDAVKAIEDEEELPGGMPDEMWEAIKNDRDGCTKSHQLVVRLTKQGILRRFKDATEAKRG